MEQTFFKSLDLFPLFDGSSMSVIHIPSNKKVPAAGSQFPQVPYSFLDRLCISVVDFRIITGSNFYLHFSSLATYFSPHNYQSIFNLFVKLKTITNF